MFLHLSFVDSPFVFSYISFPLLASSCLVFYSCSLFLSPSYYSSICVVPFVSFLMSFCCFFRFYYLIYFSSFLSLMSLSPVSASLSCFLAIFSSCVFSCLTFLAVSLLCILFSCLFFLFFYCYVLSSFPPPLFYFLSLFYSPLLLLSLFSVLFFLFLLSF